MQIWENFHVKATGTDRLEAAAHAARQLAEKLPERGADIQKASQKMRSCWKGDASEGAASGATPLSALQVATGSDQATAYQLAQNQSLAFHDTKHKVQKPPPDPGIGDYLGAAFNPFDSDTTTSMLVQAQQHQAVGQANVDAYGQYHHVSNTNGRLPEDTATLPESAPEIKVARKDGPSGHQHRKPPEPSGGEDSGNRSHGHDHSGHTVSRPPDPSGVDPGGSTTSTSGSSDTPVSHAQAPPTPSTTTTSGTTSPGNGDLPPNIGGSYGSIHDRLGGRGKPHPNEQFAGMPLAGGIGGTSGGGNVPRSGGGFGRSGGGTAGGGTGEHAPSGRTPTGKTPAGEPEAGARTGAKAGARAAEEAAMKSGTVKPGTSAGRTGMMPPGGRGGKGEGDKEHKTADYVKNPDPEGTFGTDEKTAPPVLGELPAEREARERRERGQSA